MLIFEMSLMLAFGLCDLSNLATSDCLVSVIIVLSLLHASTGILLTRSQPFYVDHLNQKSCGLAILAQYCIRLLYHELDLHFTRQQHRF